MRTLNTQPANFPAETWTDEQGRWLISITDKMGVMTWTPPDSRSKYETWGISFDDNKIVYRARAEDREAAKQDHLRIVALADTYVSVADKRKLSLLYDLREEGLVDAVSDGERNYYFFTSEAANLLETVFGVGESAGVHNHPGQSLSTPGDGGALRASGLTGIPATRLTDRDFYAPGLGSDATV